MLRESKMSSDDKLNFFYLWGMPILIAKLDPKKYDKEQILEDITENYNKNPNRQVWSQSFMGTNIHHSIGDVSKNFKVPDYTKLNLAYRKPTEYFIQQLNFKNSVTIEQNIANYTASKHEAFLEPHHHTGCQFSMVHYLKFNPNQNKSTVFINPYVHQEWWDDRKMLSAFAGDIKNTRFAWTEDEWAFDVEEDDLIIFPAPLKHYVKTYASENMRVTISMNIKLIDIGI